MWRIVKEKMTQLSSFIDSKFNNIDSPVVSFLQGMQVMINKLTFTRI